MNEDEMLSGSVTTGTEQGDVVVEDAERLRDANLQRVAEGMSRWCKPQSPHLDAIAAALEHAKAKHPKFADVAVSYIDFRKAVDQIAIAREYLADKVKANRCGGMTVLMCEVYEAIEAFSRKDYHATMEELAQCGAVVVRMMEAVQELADETAKAGKAGEGAKMKDCECVNWCRDGLHVREEMLAGHHYRCPEFESEFRRLAMELIERLRDSMRKWGNEEDGVPDFAWKAFCYAEAVSGPAKAAKAAKAWKGAE